MRDLEGFCCQNAFCLDASVRDIAGRLIFLSNCPGFMPMRHCHFRFDRLGSRPEFSLFYPP